MTDPTLTFKCLEVTKREDGLIRRYHLEVTDTQSGRTVTFSVEPRHLASFRNMKKILLERRMVYSATRETHDQMLLKLRPYLKPCS